MSVDYTSYKVDPDASDKVTADTFNLFIDRLQSDMNNIENDQIPDDEIALVKVEGGAVPESDVATDGSANKIVKTDASGNVTITDGGSIKVVLS